MHILSHWSTLLSCTNCQCPPPLLHHSPSTAGLEDCAPPTDTVSTSSKVSTVTAAQQDCQAWPSEALPGPHPWRHSCYSGDFAGNDTEDSGTQAVSLMPTDHLLHICCVAWTSTGVCNPLILHPAPLQHPAPQYLHLLHCKGTAWGPSSLWQAGEQIHLPWCHSC